MGRPSTAAEIWQDDRMCHALTRLYLYTLLSTDDISRLMTVVARNYIGHHVGSAMRSTTTQLNKLLAEDGARLYPQKIRPQSEAYAHERAAFWRSQKRLRRDRHLSRASNHQRADMHNPTSANEGQHIRLSWVQQALPDVPENAWPEIRSILTWRSSQSSTLSRSSSTRSHQGPVPAHQALAVNSNLTALDESLANQGVDWGEIAPWTDQSVRIDGTSWAGPTPPPRRVAPANITLHHDLLLILCCGNQEDCLHRQVERTVEGCGRLTVEDFALSQDKDMLGETVRHIAARWASVDFFFQIMETWIRADSRSMNSKNVHGDTFLHILGPMWIDTQPKALLEILVASCHRGFDILSRNLEGKNFFSCLLPPASAKMPPSQLYDRTKGLQYLLSETPNDVLMLLLLSQAPTSRQQTVASYMQDLLVAHAKATTDYRPQVFATSVSRLFGDKISTNTGPVTPLLPAPNLMHQHLHYLSVTPWEAPLDLLSTFANLLRDGMDPNEYDMYGSVAMSLPAAVLHHVGLGYLSENKGVDLISLLCSHGADLHLVTGAGETPLHMAIRLSLPAAVARLIELRADLMALNTAGRTALDYPLVQRALRKGKSADSRGYASAHRVLVSIFDAAGRRGLRWPHKLARTQDMSG